MKTTLKAYVIYFFLGMVGGHRFYTGNKRSAWIMIALSFAGFLTYGLAWLVLLIWVFIDLFRIPEMVRTSNMMAKAFPYGHKVFL